MTILLIFAWISRKTIFVQLFIIVGCVAFLQQLAILSLNTVKRWMNSYVEGNFDTKDKERSGRSSLDIEDEMTVAA